MNYRAITCIVFLFLAGCSGGTADYVRGTVKDAITGEPIADAVVFIQSDFTLIDSVETAFEHTKTNRRGAFGMRTEYSDHRGIIAIKEGYRTGGLHQPKGVMDIVLYPENVAQQHPLTEQESIFISNMVSQYYVVLGKETGNPAFCETIAAKIANRPRYFDISRCYQDAAFTARDASICGSIPVGGLYGDDRATCVRKVAQKLNKPELCALFPDASDMCYMHYPQTYDEAVRLCENVRNTTTKDRCYMNAIYEEKDRLSPEPPTQEYCQLMSEEKLRGQETWRAWCLVARERIQKGWKVY